MPYSSSLSPNHPLNIVCPSILFLGLSAFSFLLQFLPTLTTPKSVTQALTFLLSLRHDFNYFLYSYLPFKCSIMSKLNISNTTYKLCSCHNFHVFHSLVTWHHHDFSSKRETSFFPCGCSLAFIPHSRRSCPF